MIENFFIVLATSLLILVVLYFAVRLGTSAYYRSKREFETWYNAFKERK